MVMETNPKITKGGTKLVKKKIAQSKVQVNGEIKVSFGAKRLSNLGGAVNLFKFIERFGLASIIDEHLPLAKRANKFTSSQLLMCLLSLPMPGLISKSLGLTSLYRTRKP